MIDRFFFIFSDKRKYNMFSFFFNLNISVLFFTELSFFLKCLNKYPSHCFQNTFWIERGTCHLVQNRKKCNPQCMSSFFKKIKNSELKITL